MLSDPREWIEARTGIVTSGYITKINNPDAGSTVLVGHGPSARIQQQILDEARRRRIPISIQQREYARAAHDSEDRPEPRSVDRAGLWQSPADPRIEAQAATAQWHSSAATSCGCRAR